MAQIRDLDALKDALSVAATIEKPDDAGFATSIARWNDKGAPKPGAVVHVASEADIEATVCVTTV